MSEILVDTTTTYPGYPEWYYRTVLLSSHDSTGEVRILSMTEQPGGSPVVKITTVTTLGKNDSYLVNVDDARRVIAEYDKWVSERASASASA